MHPLLHCRNITSALLISVLAACAEPPARVDNGAAAGLLFLPDAPPRLVVSDSQDILSLAERVEQVEQAVGDRPGRRIEPAAAAFLQGSPAGRVFQRATGGRALARGEPPETCPAIGLVTRSEAVPTTTLAQEAMRACLDDLEQTGGEDCGCRLLAVNATLLASLDAFAHAPGVGARLVGLGSGLSRPLIAREDPEARSDGVSLVTFTGVDAAVATATLRPDGTATLELADGTRFEGYRERHGWRRGRMTERLLLRDAAGARLIALIGFEPLDFARDGAQLAAWPRGLPG